MDEFTAKSELENSIHKLKQDPAWKYLSQILTNWKNQAVAELSVVDPKQTEKVCSAQADFKAYSRLLQLPDIILSDLTTKPDLDLSDFDAYGSSRNSVP